MEHSQLIGQILPNVVPMNSLGSVSQVKAEGHEVVSILPIEVGHQEDQSGGRSDDPRTIPHEFGMRRQRKDYLYGAEVLAVGHARECKTQPGCVAQL